MKKNIWYLFYLFSVLLIIATLKQWVVLTFIEVFGFISGALCVLLVVEENILNWPIGIVNNIFFIALFLKTKLYADMMLQVVYIVLGILGWYWWLYGGKNKTILKVSNISVRLIILLILIGSFATYEMTLFLRSINDSAPFLDALTTVLSLVAQFMLTKKFIENWYVWISADFIYIGLYIYKNLYLTSFLYLLFIGLCVMGLTSWNKSKKITNAKIFNTVEYG